MTVPSGTGECWTTLDADDQQSRVANGPLKGTPVTDLVLANPQGFVGRRHPAGQRFPLCARLLDVGQPQPLLVHRSDEAPYAQPGTGGAANSKFWYSLAHAPGAEIMVGIRQRITRLQFVQRLNSPALKDALQVFPARPGDSFFIPPGQVHSLGAGNLVWELQQSPAPPETVSGWSPREDPGCERQEGALMCVRFEDRQLGRIVRESGRVAHTRKIPLVRLCPSFQVEEIRLADHLFDRTTGASFHLLTVVRGTVQVEWADGHEQLTQGEVCCVPAQQGDYRLRTVDGPSSLLRVMLQGAA